MSNWRGQGMGARCWDHVSSDADEKLVLDQYPQGRQIVTHGGLLKTQTCRRLGHVAIAHQRVECDQQVQVERP